MVQESFAGRSLEPVPDARDIAMPHNNQIGARFAGVLFNLTFGIAFICFDHDVDTARLSLLRYAGQLGLQPLFRGGGIIERIPLGLSFRRRMGRYTQQNKPRSDALGKRYRNFDRVLRFRSAIAAHDNFFKYAAHRDAMIPLRVSCRAITRNRLLRSWGFRVRHH